MGMSQNKYVPISVRTSERNVLSQNNILGAREINNYYLHFCFVLSISMLTVSGPRHHNWFESIAIKMKWYVFFLFLFDDDRCMVRQ